MNNLLIFAIIKNDNQWLDEWVRYHLAIGVSHILIYDNNDGMEDYPMSDYIIEQCTKKNITIINKRDKNLYAMYEFNHLPDEWNKYEFKTMLQTNEFISFKDGICEFNKVFLTNSALKVIPYDVVNGVEHVNIKRLKGYPNKLVKKLNSFKTNDVNKVYIKKILSIE